MRGHALKPSGSSGNQSLPERFIPQSNKSKRYHNYEAYDSNLTGSWSAPLRAHSLFRGQTADPGYRSIAGGAKADHPPKRGRRYGRGDQAQGAINGGQREDRTASVAASSQPAPSRSARFPRSDCYAQSGRLNFTPSSHSRVTGALQTSHVVSSPSCASSGSRR